MGEDDDVEMVNDISREVFVEEPGMDEVMTDVETFVVEILEVEAAECDIFVEDTVADIVVRDVTDVVDVNCCEVDCEFE